MIFCYGATENKCREGGGGQFGYYYDANQRNLCISTSEHHFGMLNLPSNVRVKITCKKWSMLLMSGYRNRKH